MAPSYRSNVLIHTQQVDPTFTDPIARGDMHLSPSQKMQGSAYLPMHLLDQSENMPQIRVEAPQGFELLHCKYFYHRNASMIISSR